MYYFAVNFTKVDTDIFCPVNPRCLVDIKSLCDLSHSIKSHGIGRILITGSDYY